MSELPALKKVCCVVCASDVHRVRYVIKGLQIVQCSDCSFVYVNSRMPDENLYGLYQKNYFNNPEIGYSNYTQHKSALIKTFEERLAFIQPFVKSREHVLDVGCASGYFLDVLAAQGWKGIEGIELDPELAKELKLKYNVFDQPIEKIKLEQQYDLITLFDVIEHIPLLNEALENIKNGLAADGLFVIATPNYDSWQRKLLGKRWPHFKPLEHIYYFDATSLTKILGNHKLKVLKIIPQGTYYEMSYVEKRMRQYGFNGAGAVLGFINRILKLKNKFIHLNSGGMLVLAKHAKD